MSEMNVPKLRFREFEGEWVEKKLGDIATFFNSKRIALTESDRKNGIYPYYGASGIIDYVEDYIFDGEYILLGEDGANIVMRNSRLVFLAKGKFWLNNHAHIFQAKESNTFLCEALERINYSKYNTGTTQPKLNSVIVKNIKLNLPQKPEQQKIANFLTSIDQKIEQLTKKEKLLVAYKKGIMQKIFSQEIRFRDENGEVYGDWVERKLGEVGKIITGSTPTTSKREYYNGCKQFVSPVDIQKNRYITNTKTTLTDLGFAKGRKVNKNSVCFVCIGSTIGKVAQVIEDCITNQQINSITTNLENDDNFLFSLLEFKASRIKLLAGEQAVPQINKTDFSNLKFHFPSLAEQTKIANFLSSIDKKIEQVNQQIEENKGFKKGLLQQMFV